MVNDNLNGEIIQNYSELHDVISSYLRECCLVTHFPVKGNVYHEQSVKLLLVGRALNGWTHKSEFDGAFPYEKLPDRSEYAETGTRAVCEKNRYAFFEENKKENYDTVARSAFWRTTRTVSRVLIGFPEDEENWYERIAWANLFPVAPSEGGNPSGKLISSQRSVAKKILKTTIDAYQPTHILFETGWDYWMYYRKNSKNKNAQYECMLDGIPKSDIRKISGIKGTVLWYGRIGDSKIVIAIRPERKDEEKYAEEVLKAFYKL